MDDLAGIAQSVFSDFQSFVSGSVPIVERFWEIAGTWSENAYGQFMAGHGPVVFLGIALVVIAVLGRDIWLFAAAGLLAGLAVQVWPDRGNADMDAATRYVIIAAFGLLAFSAIVTRITRMRRAAAAKAMRAELDEALAGLEREKSWRMAAENEEKSRMDEFATVVAPAPAPTAGPAPQQRAQPLPQQHLAPPRPVDIGSQRGVTFSATPTKPGPSQQIVAANLT